MTYISILFETFERFWNALQHGTVLPLGNWNYILLFIFVIIQGPLVKLLSGAVVSTTYLNLYLVIIVSIFASISADIGWYSIGRMGKFQRYFRRNTAKRQKMVEALQSAMHRHYFKVLLLGKLTIGISMPTVLAAGISKISWRKWLPVVVLGEIIYSILFVLVGFFAAESISHADKTIKLVGFIFTGIFLVILIIYLPNLLRKTLKEEPQNLKNNPGDV